MMASATWRSSATTTALDDLPTSGDSRRQQLPGERLQLADVVGIDQLPRHRTLDDLADRRFSSAVPVRLRTQETAPAASAARAPSCASWTATRQNDASPWASSPGSRRSRSSPPRAGSPHETVSGVPFSSTSSTSNVVERKHPLEPLLDLDQRRLVLRLLPEPLVHDDEPLDAVAVRGDLVVQVREVVLAAGTRRTASRLRASRTHGSRCRASTIVSSPSGSP